MVAVNDLVARKFARRLRMREFARGRNPKMNTLLGVTWFVALAVLAALLVRTRNMLVKALEALDTQVKDVTDATRREIQVRVKKEEWEAEEKIEVMNKVNDVRNRLLTLDGQVVKVAEFVKLDKKVALLDGKGTVSEMGWTPEAQGKIWKPENEVEKG